MSTNTRGISTMPSIGGDTTGTLQPGAPSATTNSNQPIGSNAGGVYDMMNSPGMLQASGHGYDQAAFQPPPQNANPYSGWPNSGFQGFGGGGAGGSSFSSNTYTPPAATSGVGNPYADKLAAAMTASSNKNLMDNVLPGVNRGAQTVGGYGGSRHGLAQGNAIAGAQTGLDQSLAQMYASGYENEANRATQTGLAASQNGLSRDLANMQYQLGNQNSLQNFYTANRGQDLQELGLGAGLLGQANQGFLGQGQGIYGLGTQEQNAPWQNLQNYSGILQPGVNLGGTTTTAGGGQSGGQQAAQLAAQLAMMVAFAGSDKRIKEDIHKIAKRDDGLNVYEYKYKPEYRDTWGHGKQFGLMAQEVEKKYPEAVATHPDGYKMVAYGLLG